MCPDGSFQTVAPPFLQAQQWRNSSAHLMCSFTHSSCRYLLNFEHTCAVLWAFSSPWKRHYRTFQCQVGSRELRNLLIIWNSTFLPDTAVQKLVQTASSVVGGSVPPLLNYFLVVCCQSMGSEARGMWSCHGDALQPPSKPCDLSQISVHLIKKACNSWTFFSLIVLVHNSGQKHWLVANCSEHTGIASLLTSGGRGWNHLQSVAQNP